MTSKTLTKARKIYKAGGVKKTATTTYRVRSTSGEAYLVHLRTDTCTCPATGMCSHKAAVELARSAKRKLSATA
jgi:uncharacterized Zn finger protein